MRRSLGAFMFAAALLAGCGSQPAAQVPSGADPATTPEAIATPEPTPEPSITLPLPAKYAKLTSRNWAKVVKAPDTYIGKGYLLWGCITQFDAATGVDTFRADTSYQKEQYWYSAGANAFFIGDEAKLADFVQGDVVYMSVMGLGSYSYDTQAGGNTTVPLFQVVKIQRKGSC